MIKFKTLFETVYEPRSGDEKNFKDKHVIAKHKYPADTESQFTSDKPKAKRKADYDEGDDVAVYEAANVHTKRADKKPVIVRDVDPKTGQSRTHTELRRVGEIKIGEEVELEEGTVGHGKYTITTGPKMKGMGEGGPSHVVAKRAKMAKLGVPHHDTPGDYGDTVKVTVKNNDTGETTHHHVYQRDTDKGSKEALVSTRTVGTPRAKQKEHENVLHNYLSGKKVSSLKEESVVVTELGEKVVNPYAVGMAAAMKQTGDRPPLKKSTIIKGHEIAKGIKNEAMDPVGKEDSDIDNNGKVDKSDKYLKNRRKAIGRALQKEETSTDQENSSYSIYKKSNKPNPIKKNAEDAVKEGYTKPEKDKVKAEKDGLVQIMKAQAAMKAKKSVKEEVDQLDELSPNTLHKYIKKATPEVAARAISAVAPNQSAETKKHASKLGKRIAGITSASGRLSDKANAMHEEADLDEAVEVRHDRYLRSHGKKARDSGQGSGHWMFTHKSMGDVDYNNDKEVHTARGKFADAKKSAQKWAKENGHHSVYVMEEVEQIDELSKNTLGSYIKKSSQKVAYKANHAGEIEGRGDSNITPAARSTLAKLNRKTVNGLVGISRATNRLTKEDAEHLDEAFKVGTMKLQDGSSVTLTRESVEALNGLFNQLTGANKSKMESHMLSGKKGFQEILSFAENI